MKFQSESERLKICGRYFYKKRGETYRKLANKYGCSSKTGQQAYLNCSDDPALLAAAKIGQLSAARSCPAPAGRQDKASNVAAAAQPSPLPHGGGAAARALDASHVPKSSFVSADLVLQVQQRMPHGDDSRRIIALLERNLIRTIQDLARLQESDFDIAEWGNRADIDAVRLDDSAWEKAYWPEKFIR